MNKTYYVTIILICLFIISTISSVDSFSTAKKKNKKKVKKVKSTTTGETSGKTASSSSGSRKRKKKVKKVKNSDSDEHVCDANDETCQENSNDSDNSKNNKNKNSEGNGASSTDFQIQHSVNPASPFVDRGTIDVEISKLSKKIITRVKSRDELTMEETKDILEQALTDGYYRIRIQAKAGDDEGGYVTASIPACALVIGGFREQLYLHLDFNGNLLGVEYRTPLTKAYKCKEKHLRKKISKLGEDSIKLSTSATSAMPRKAFQVPVVLKGPPAPPPPGMEHLKKKDPAAENKPENQSFLRRYWYIILPMVFILLTSGGK